MERGTRVGAVILAGALLGPVAHVEAQHVEVGVRAGFAGTTIAWTPSPLGGGPEAAHRRHGGTGGVFLSVGGQGRVGMRVEALLAQKGFADHQSDGDVTRLSVDYVEVPVLVELALRPRSNRLVPQLFAGPWIATEARCNVELESVETDLSFDCDEVPGEPVLRRKVDWGVILGAGLAVSGVGPFRASLDLRYSAGLRNIDAEAAADNIDAHHRGIATTLGLALPIGP